MLFLYFFGYPKLFTRMVANNSLEKAEPI